jgi:Fe2+ or Zn2+ uptake regulation protein
MPGNYGMIIDRKADYSIVPVDVYNVLNSLEQLKAIAIVVHNKKSFFPLSAEQKLYQGKLEVFHTISEARQWIEEILNTTD